MSETPKIIAALAGLLLGIAIGNPASAEKAGGTLKMYFFDSPASMSIHEEATIAGQGPMMGVFNNLVMYDQHVAQTSLNSIVPDLATEWSWDEDKTALTFKLRQGVKWDARAPTNGRLWDSQDVIKSWEKFTAVINRTLNQPSKALVSPADVSSDTICSQSRCYEGTFRLLPGNCAGYTRNKRNIHEIGRNINSPDNCLKVDKFVARKGGNCTSDCAAGENTGGRSKAHSRGKTE
jgi:hypothetical protein